MNLPVNLGDVPTWLQGVGGIVQVAEAVWRHRRTRAAEFGRRLQDETELDDDALARAIAERAELGPLVFEGIEAAMKAAAEEKRWLLAKVLAAAFEGDDTRIDEVGLFLRTAAALEPPDIRVIAEFIRPRPANFSAVPMVGAIGEAELAESLPSDQVTLLAPIVARLAREGLIVDAAIGTLGYNEPAWFLTSYGYRFLRYLPGRSAQELMGASVVGVWANGNVDRLLLKNLGPGRASVRQISISLGPTPTSIQHATPVPVVEDEGTLVAGANLEISPKLPVEIEAGQTWEIACLGHGAKVLFAATTLELEWVDEAGATGEASCDLPHRG